MPWTARPALLPHQGDAAVKLLPSRVGALFAEMGTGKTRIAIELARLRQDKIDHVVWSCPVSAKETIRRLILKHTDADPADIHVFDQRTCPDHLPSARWYVVGTESVSASARVVRALSRLITEHSFVVVDESHQIKGHCSRRTERLTLLAAKARYRLILTGTPISQGVVDLFAQMRFLSPKILGYRSFYSFARNHLIYSDRFPGRIEREHDTEYLAARIKPYVYQVTKEECLDLPDKRYASRYCAMTHAQHLAYAEAKERILLEEYLQADDWERRIAIFHLFTVLQTIVCGFQTLPDGTVARYPHDRLTALADALAGIPPGAPVVIWAKYRRAIEDIVGALSAAHGPDQVHAYHGGLTPRARTQTLDAWRRNGRFIVATQAAGGTAIDLTPASHVVYYANGFKYAERQQSEDRCHRIGQDRPVTYIDIWSDAGIDTRIDRALGAKASVVAAFRSEVERVRGGGKDRVRELVKSL
jgi:SNF2 family DNA or RNA helicase